MDGLDILVRSLSQLVPRGPERTMWQYHSRSDHHSKVACWGVLFDLLQTSGLLREHFRTGKVVLGVNHKMRDYTRNKSKALDLVVARPDTSASAPRRPRTLTTLVDEWAVDLTSDQRRLLLALPDAIEGPVSSVHLALEAKAAMTAHSKALPRLFDELNSSHQIVHGASSHALSIGFVMVNAAESFYSPGRNLGADSTTASVASEHRQPYDAVRTVQHVQTLPRRGSASEHGYDGLAIVVVRMRNDGSPVELVDDSPAPGHSSVWDYEQTILRVAGEYDAAFHRV